MSSKLSADRFWNELRQIVIAHWEIMGRYWSGRKECTSDFNRLWVRVDGINSLNECQKEEAEVIYLKNENDVKYYLSKS